MKQCRRQSSRSFRQQDPLTQWHSITFQQPGIYSTTAVRMTSLVVSLALDVVVEWLAVLPCVWVVWVADHGLESRCPDWHFTRKIQGSISS